MKLGLTWYVTPWSYGTHLSSHFSKTWEGGDKINKYVEGNKTHNYKREFGISLEMFPRSCISIVRVVFEFCVKLKIRFYNFMSCRNIKYFSIVLST